MLAYCLWHRPKIKTALGQRLMFAGILCDQSSRNQYIIAYIYFLNCRNTENKKIIILYLKL